MIYGGKQIYVGKNQSGPRTDAYSSSPSKIVKYTNDGKGRDWFISHSNGGFYPGIPAAEYTLNFKDQLRIGHQNNKVST